MINGKVQSKTLSSIPCSPKSKYNIVSISSPKEKLKISTGAGIYGFNMYRSVRPDAIHTSPPPREPTFSPQSNDETMDGINKYIAKSDAWGQSKSINGTIFRGRNIIPSLRTKSSGLTTRENVAVIRHHTPAPSAAAQIVQNSDLPDI